MKTKKLTRDEIAFQILKTEAEMSRRRTRIEEALGGPYGRTECGALHGDGLHSLALDLLGVPPDVEGDGPDSFCRDWLGQEWFDYEQDGKTSDQSIWDYIQWVKSEVA